ncbi:conserved hypothetical protein [Rhodospirillaceae bacterium LM-1]|nr:conserved hypothetical protein [Rhodospirillaceae bacterium LM-1]
MADVYVVHCIDTEGPLYETLPETFIRIEKHFGLKLPPRRDILEKLQQQKLDLGGMEAKVARMVDPALLALNDSWDKLDAMLDDITSPEFRSKFADSQGNGWIYNWFLVDHVDYDLNPRRRDMGYHNIFDHYRQYLTQADAPCSDGLHFHYHPAPYSRQAHHSSRHWFAHSDTLFQVLARRIIDRQWFPSVNRPGFNVTRPDSHWFLEQFIPFDYSNQGYKVDERADETTSINPLWDWGRGPVSWRPYHPSHDDHQTPGACRRWILRCLNLGTWHCLLRQSDVDLAFEEAATGTPVVLAFTNHDFRDMRPDIAAAHAMLTNAASRFPDVRFIHSEARSAARQCLGITPSTPCNLRLEIKGNTLSLCSDQPTFGPQPFLAIRTVNGDYRHDALDADRPFHQWTCVLDEYSVPLELVDKVGFAVCNAAGDVTVLVWDRASGKTIVETI